MQEIKKLKLKKKKKQEKVKQYQTNKQENKQSQPGYTDSALSESFSFAFFTVLEPHL